MSYANYRFLLYYYFINAKFYSFALCHINNIYIVSIDTTALLAFNAFMQILAGCFFNGTASLL